MFSVRRTTHVPPGMFSESLDIARCLLFFGQAQHRLCIVQNGVFVHVYLPVF